MYQDFAKIEESHRKKFSTHKATLVQNTDRYFIADWRREDGSSDSYVNYILDKKYGTLIVSGDLGDCIATWGNHVEPGQLSHYVTDVWYFISKIECASNVYNFAEENVLADIKNIFDEFGCTEALEDFIVSSSGVPYSSTKAFWNEVRSEIEISTSMSSSNRAYFCASESLYNTIFRFSEDCGDWLPECGRTIDARVFYWSLGFRMLCEQLGLN